MIFLKPTHMDVHNLKDLLLLFGQTTGLSTNIQKTSVKPISCDNIDLDDILANLPVKRQGFPLKYLGLPLTVRCLRRAYFQPIVDKAAARLSMWNRRNFTQSLTKSMLSSASQPIYMLTVLKPPQEVLDNVDKDRKQSLWVGTKNSWGKSARSTGLELHFPKRMGASRS